MKTVTKKKVKVKKVVKPRPKPEAKKNTSLAIVNDNEGRLSLTTSRPAEIMKFGLVLRDYIVANNLSVNIGGSEYAMVDGWKFAGLNFGLTAIPRKPVKVHQKGEYVKTITAMKEFNRKDGTGKYKKEVNVFVGYWDDAEVIESIKIENGEAIQNEITRPYFAYECECDIKRLSDGVLVGYGQGFCSNLESLKSGFDEYSVNSMSQTRAIGKAYRNLLGHIMKSAGYETTPAEEMEEMKAQGKKEKEPEPEIKLAAPTKGQWEKMKGMFQRNEITLEKIKMNFFISEELEKELTSLPKVLPSVDDEGFKQIMKDLINGSTTLEDIESKHSLSETQHNALKVINPKK